MENLFIDKNLKRLEYDKILEILSTFCITNYSKDLVYALKPYTNNIDVQNSLNLTNMALELIYRKGNIPLENFDNITVYIKSLQSNTTIHAKALLDIANVLKLARNLQSYIYSDSSFNLDNFDIITKIFDKLYSNKGIEDKIFSSIIDPTTIADNASSTLSNLRRNRKTLEESVRNKLSDYIHSSKYSKYIMDNIITIRDDRFVIPIKEEFKDNISGSILDISASGSTVYIEPSSIYELNNKINNIKAEEEIEIEKILRNLSTLLFPIVNNLEINLETIRLIDFIFAKAKYSKSINGICPNINNNKFISLINARHPLIDKNLVVPIDISIGVTYTSLLITGPNTGGKTATLKTVGLLTAMAQSGLNIPAKEGSSIYIFENIFADIGDEQSIQESLSTFSSHILNIIDILNKSSSNSLILLDELGSGTDPVEGSSLAIAILEHFYKLGALTIATTHYPELKNYALITDGFENASSDFDLINLKPTYKLLIGVPGKSNAFAISKALGLSNEILSRASCFLKQDNINIENIIKSIYDDKLEIEQEKEQIQKNSNQIELLRKSLERDNSNLEETSKNIILEATRKAREILLNAKEEANEIIKELDKENLSSKEANILRNKLNSTIQENDKITTKTDTTSNNISQIDISKLEIGMDIIVKKLKQKATILTLPNKEGNLQVQIGIMKMNLNINDISILSNLNNSFNKSNNTKYCFTNNLKVHNISPELNIIGLNVDEAIPIVDKYLDNAYLAGLTNVRIVHGKGTGKLREGIQNFLKKNSHVKSYRVGTFGEGEMGVTVVTLK